MAFDVEFANMFCCTTKAQGLFCINLKCRKHRTLPPMFSCSQLFFAPHQLTALVMCMELYAIFSFLCNGFGEKTFMSVGSLKKRDSTNNLRGFGVSMFVTSCWTVKQKASDIN